MDDFRRRPPRRQGVDEAALLDFARDHHRRQLHHPDPRQRRLPQRCRIVGDEPRSMRQRRRLPVRPFQLPLVIAPRGAEVEAEQGGEVGR